MVTLSKSRIEAALRASDREPAGKLVAYLTAGDPGLADTGGLLSALDRGGADLIELGVPFSDPMADGPVIQRASERAIRAGATLHKLLERLPEWLAALKTPLILFSYYNPVLQYGLDRFAGELASAGAAGALIVDLSPEEAGDYIHSMRRENLDTIFLASPTSTGARLRQIAGLSTGFVYVISRPGVTGERASISGEVSPLIARLRQLTQLPLAVGFGLSNPEQVAQVQHLADAAVVGSALVRAVEERYAREGAEGIERFVRWLKSGAGSSFA
ncbi:MAG: tryptophan synthase subunit alpha [Terriglobia bacterium]